MIVLILYYLVSQKVVELVWINVTARPQDEYSCDPLTEITQSKGYIESGLKPESESFVYKLDQAAFICATDRNHAVTEADYALSGLAAKMSFKLGSLHVTVVFSWVTDQGERLMVQCDENGNFDQSAAWPVCRPPSCQLADRPVDTGELSANHTDDTAVVHRYSRIFLFRSSRCTMHW